jgi:hypothetical protein
MVVEEPKRRENEAAAKSPQLKAASCGCKTAHCGCRGDKTMNRAELIATLVTDKFSGFKDGDEPILEAASDARLEELRSAADAAKTAANSALKLEADNRNLMARLKVSEERVRTAEASMTEEEFLARAPESIKSLIDAHKAEEATVRAAIISHLKGLGANTEEELKTKSTADLKNLAKYARLEVPDFSGRALARDRSKDSSGSHNYAPPDPYAAGIKKLQEKAH